MIICPSGTTAPFPNPLEIGNLLLTKSLVANPEATVELGSERFRVRATVTSGEERQRLFNRQAQQIPIFVEYQQKTTRQIPVIVLTRMN
jgi:deazaflavin-dependent oxidoreductase (nitroreductase family)